MAPYLLNRDWRLICSSYHVKNHAGIIEYCVMVHNLDGNQVFLIKKRGEKQDEVILDGV